MPERHLLRIKSLCGATMLRRLVASTSCALVLVGTVGSCSDDDNDDEARTTTTDAPATSTTTEPPGTDVAEVQALVEDLIVRLDDVTDQIVRDPTVVNDPDSELVDEFTALYAPEAEGLDGSLNAFRQSAAEGTHLEPLNSETTGRTEVTGVLEVIDDDTVKVPVCDVSTYRKLDSSGAVIEYIDGLAQPGEVWAVRADGQWRLERADVFPNTVCTTEPEPA